jgi:hypothetical protein
MHQQRDGGHFHLCRRTAIRAHVVVELCERGQHAFHQLAGGCVVDRLGDRPQRDAERFQVCTEREVVVNFRGRTSDEFDAFYPSPQGLARDRVELWFEDGLRNDGIPRSV